MNEEQTIRCPECGDEVDALSRRDFMKGVSTAAIAVSAGAWPVFATPRATAAALSMADSPETEVKRLYDSLTEPQRQAICFPWEHELRQKYGANWAITKPTIGEFFTKC